MGTEPPRVLEQWLDLKCSLHGARELSALRFNFLPQLSSCARRQAHVALLGVGLGQG